MNDFCILCPEDISMLPDLLQKITYKNYYVHKKNKSPKQLNLEGKNIILYAIQKDFSKNSPGLEIYYYLYIEKLSDKIIEFSTFYNDTKIIHIYNQSLK
jgi:hypothetical protein